jgi:hypothetical protein
MIPGVSPVMSDDGLEVPKSATLPQKVDWLTQKIVSQLKTAQDEELLWTCFGSWALPAPAEGRAEHHERIDAVQL